VQVGLGGDISLPLNVIVAKELELRGAFRFHEEFAVAVELLNKGLIDVKPLITGVFPYQESVKAFQTASDRSKAMKVLVSFD
jgi:L-idonate 5-dehydrogenase